MYRHSLISPKEILNSVLLSKFVYSDLNKLPPLVDNLQLVNTFDRDNTEGAIYHDVTDDTLYVSFRGTSEGKDFRTDATYFSKNFLDTKAHRGFVNAFYEIEHAMLNGLNNFMLPEKEYTLVICGHSLGGAIAHLAFYYLLYTQCVKFKDIRLVTAGSPKVFFKKNLTETHKHFIDKAVRITHADDVVPEMPPQTIILTLTGCKYVHIGQHWNIGTEDDSHGFKEHKIQGYIDTLMKEGVVIG